MNLRAWAETQTGPQQLSASLTSVLPEFSNELNSPDLDSGQAELEFQQYLQDKLLTEQLALAPKPETDIDEVPKPLSRENYLHVFGFRNFRVRNHGSVARIELDESDFKTILNKKLRFGIDEKFKKLGFKFVSLDLKSFESGSSFCF